MTKHSTHRVPAVKHNAMKGVRMKKLISGCQRACSTQLAHTSNEAEWCINPEIHGPPLAAKRCVAQKLGILGETDSYDTALCSFSS